MIVYNAVKTPDGTILESYHRHDYKSHTDSVTSKTYSVDGGLSYLKRGGYQNDLQEMSLTDEDSIELIREKLRWGTFGPNGDMPCSWAKLKDLSDDHIKNIVEICNPDIKEIMQREYLYRKNNNISVRDKYSQTLLH